MSEQPDSSGTPQFIWSVADLLRDYKAHEYARARKEVFDKIQHDLGGAA